MSSHLWRAYFENDLEKFRSLLGLSEDRTGGTNEHPAGSLTNEHSFDLSSPPRRQSTFSGYNAIPGTESRAVTLNRFQINSRLPANIIANPLAPITGLTLLHHAATANKLEFVEALLKHPQTDLFLQDFESGWTALHRALYFGNISVAKQILSRSEGVGLIKIKDREGNSPFELFESTIKVETVKHGLKPDNTDEFGEDSDEDNPEPELLDLEVGQFKGEYLGDETFIWGSNKNVSLGFSDGDDRQFPERMPIPRPDSDGSQDSLITLAPIYVKDIQLAKFHSAIITTALSNNLYICGHGQGGRLGLGHQSTEFTFRRVELPRRVSTVALGQGHTVAVLENGDVFTWGTGRYGQLGYPANIDKNDKEEYQLVPRQVFTNLRREKVIGAAASKHHSAVHTIDSIFVFGKNEGQLGLVDADSRTLEAQTSPRKVAAAVLSEQPISMITVTDKATAILLENHDVWVLMNFGIMKLTFPFERFPNTGIKPTRPTSKYQSKPNFITKITSGGNTIAALARMGDVFTINVEKSTATTTRTLPVPQRIWSLRKRHMAVRDIDVGQEGAVIICTESGSVWQRTRRSKVKEIQGLGSAYSTATLVPQLLDRAKDYKFARIPGLTHIVGVRSNAYGSFAAIRRDVDILKTKLEVRRPTLWDDLGSLLSFHDDLNSPGVDENTDDITKPDPNDLRQRAMDWFLQEDFINILKETIHEMDLTEYDTVIRSAELDDIGISVPAHSFMLTGRCPQLRSLFAKAMKSRTVHHEGIVELHHHPGGTFDLTFKGINWFSLLIFIFYLYKDVVVTVWTKFSKNKEKTLLFQRVRADLGMLANSLGLKQLAAIASGLYSTKLTLDTDLEEALSDPFFQETGDMLLELKDDTVKVHSSLLCARCSFFDALYHGGSGRWLATRKEEEEYAADQLIRVDMKHVTIETMGIVLKFLYSDKSLHLFDSAKATEDGVDAFIDLVIDVLSVANELMLDRLVEICQRVIGRFVNTRNATSILAAISESSVPTFKEVCLEYIFRNLDTMMEIRALEEFDEDLMAELDEAVKERQLAYMPFSRSGRAEVELLERHPHLASSAENEQQALVQLLEGGAMSISMAAEVDFASSPASYRQSSSFRAGSYEKQRRRRSSKSGQERPPTKTPPLLPVQGSELIFDMDDEDSSSKSRKTPISQSPALNRNDSYGLGSTPKTDVWYDCKGKQISLEGVSSQVGLDETIPKPWILGPGIQSDKLDMREIITQASKNRTSNLSLGLSSASIDPAGVGGLPASNFNAPITTKVSQKERKRQQQLQSQQAACSPVPPLASTPDKSIITPKASPWKAVRSPSNPLSLQQQPSSSPLSTPRKDNTPSKLLDVFQTPPPAQSPLNINTPPRQVTSPKGTQPVPPRHNLPTPPPQVHTLRYNSSGNVIPTDPLKSVSSPTQPRSERYDDFPPLSGRVEQIHLPLAEIIQQEQIQQDIIKGKGPKQSLQEIQQEQEFMDWWEKESERYQQESQGRQVLQQEQKAVGVNRGRGRGGARGGRANFRGRGGKSTQSGQNPQLPKDVPGTAKRGPPEKGVIRGRRRGRGKGGQEANTSAEASVKVQ
ncbi:hypothetical protein TWF970_005229 [Orbilia oligospora]|uniref:BTB domain-containing protein n=1 Tax=Orbilia oligospora TaxID=2813651 RepID=A0A7C8RC99_ORBOL|nr:hypothetical protein TWF970_005229 [Orbilia oligospora]